MVVSGNWNLPWGGFERAEFAVRNNGEDVPKRIHESLAPAAEWFRTLRPILLALTCCSSALTAAAAEPSNAITFAVDTGLITPAGVVPFDQWITATSNPPLTPAAGDKIASTAILEYCHGSRKDCPSSVKAGGPCKDLPVTASCTVPVTIIPSLDGKTSTVRVDIPPLRYNSAYQLFLSQKKAVTLTAAELRRIDVAFNAGIDQLALIPGDSPTAVEVCNSLVNAIQQGIKDPNVQIDTSLSSCAAGTATGDQITAMQKRISDAINTKDDMERAQRLFDAKRNGITAQDVSDAKEAHDNAVRALEGSFRRIVSTNIYTAIPLGTAADAATTRASHVSMDAGLIYGWGIHDSVVYFGANIYTRPINTDVSLASLKSEGMLSWRHRFSFTLGATIGGIDKPGQREGIVGTSAIVAGVGWRLTDVVRLSGGVLIFKQHDPNPLVTNDTSLTVSPYVGLSFDVDIAKKLGKIFAGLP